MSKKKRRPNRFKTVDWTTLESGDKIDVTGKSGPYMELSGGRKSWLGAKKGVYIVQRLTGDGIIATKNSQHHFIYMGPIKKTEIGFAAPHKFKKVLY